MIYPRYVSSPVPFQTESHSNPFLSSVYIKISPTLDPAQRFRNSATGDGCIHYIHLSGAATYGFRDSGGNSCSTLKNLARAGVYATKVSSGNRSSRAYSYSSAMQRGFALYNKILHSSRITEQN